LFIEELRFWYNAIGIGVLSHVIDVFYLEPSCGSFDIIWKRTFGHAYDILRSEFENMVPASLEFIRSPHLPDSSGLSPPRFAFFVDDRVDNIDIPRILSADVKWFRVWGILKRSIESNAIRTAWSADWVVPLWIVYCSNPSYADEEHRYKYLEIFDLH
jgi:hypothetical protein